MKKKSIITFLVIILIAGLSIFFYLQNKDSKTVSAKVGTEIGEAAPNFTLPNLNNKKINLSDYQGTKVFINFWASWCPPCRAEMPDLQTLNENYKDEIVILAVNVGENKSTAANFMMQNELNFSVLLDKDKSTAQNYLVRGVPTSYLLDQNGVIINKVVGAISYQKMLELAELE
jgi:thiol-disulfide isomerase/thioredoxin